jgi:hypothetical protein
MNTFNVERFFVNDDTFKKIKLKPADALKYI